jgi:UDP-N-acetyl-D-glucosamine dehydrogenase
MKKLQDKISKKEITLGVIGLGYVGLPLALEFCNVGIKVIGIDNDSRKIGNLKRGISYISDVGNSEIKKMLDNKLLVVSNDYALIEDCDAVSICVPTPLRKTKEPDISYIQSAISEIKKHLHPEMIVVLESTTYPGTTEELILPELESSGLRIGEDYFLAFSPERVDPANLEYNTKNTPKVIGGITENCTKLASSLYELAIDTIVPVSNTRSAEFVKLLENTFRAINIGLANELSLICDRLNLDAWEIIDAAKTKPFGFMPFYPGPGLGGHCIPIDPLYLTWKLRAFNAPTRFISLADEINSNMPRFVANKASHLLNLKKKSVNGSKILILGGAYKKNINDYRESPALDVIALLKGKGAEVDYTDEYIEKIVVGNETLHSVDISEDQLKDYDLVIIVTDHDYFDWKRIVSLSNEILDTRNVLKDFAGKEDKITKL